MHIIQCHYLPGPTQTKRGTSYMCYRYEFRAKTEKKRHTHQTKPNTLPKQQQPMFTITTTTTTTTKNPS